MNDALPTNAEWEQRACNQTLAESLPTRVNAVNAAYSRLEFRNEKFTSYTQAFFQGVHMVMVM